MERELLGQEHPESATQESESYDEDRSVSGDGGAYEGSGAQKDGIKKEEVTRDAWVEVLVSDDRMSVSMMVYGPSGGGSDITEEMVYDVLEQKGVEVRVQTAIEMRAMAEPYIRSKAIRHLEKGRVVIFGCGTGNPFFSTDTAAVLRAAEIDADAILLAKNIDGVYSADPKKVPDAVKYDSITYSDVLAQRLQVMDSTATSLSMDNKIPVLLFALKDPENILRAVMGEKIGTIVQG